MKQKLFQTKNLVQMALLACLAAVLMLFEIPLPFAPFFYELDFSEVPILIGAFLMGPLAGMVIEFVKILLNLVMNGTITFGIGECANLLIGCSLIMPASWIYRRKNNRISLILGCIVGIIVLVIVGALLNYFVLLPFYSQFMPIEQIIQAGAAVNAFVYDMKSLILWAVVPFNLLKGVLVSVITILLYPKLEKALKK